MSTFVSVEALEKRSLLAGLAPDLRFGDEGALTGPPRDGLSRTVPLQTFLGRNADGILAFVYQPMGRQYVPSVQRYTLDGGVDANFDPITLDRTVSAVYMNFPVALDAQGRILVTSNAQSGPVQIARHTRTGALDTAFGENGVTAIPFPEPTGERFNSASIEHVRAAPDGSVYVAATLSTNVIGKGGLFRSRRWLTRINADGTFDNTFGGGDGFLRIGGNEPGLIGSASDAFSQKISTLTVDPLGRAVVGTQEAPNLYTVRRFLTNGDPDPTFGHAGVFRNSSALDRSYVMALDATGRPVIASDRNVVLFRLTLAGQLDQSFGESGTGAVINLASGSNQDISNVVAAEDGKIVLHVRGEGGQFFVRLTETGRLDSSFDSDGKADYLNPRGDTQLMDSLPDGTLLTNLEHSDLADTIQKLAPPSPVDYAPGTDTLFVRGTDAGDAVTITAPSAGVVRVILNGVSTDITDPVRQLDITLGEGANTFDSATINVPTTVIAGSGDDQIVTGNNEDRVRSGDGVDTVITNSGRDDIFLGGGDKTVDSGYGGGYVWTSRVDGTDPISNIVVRGTGTRGDQSWSLILERAKVDVLLGGARASVRVYSNEDHLIDLSEVTGEVDLSTGAGDDSILTGAGDDEIFAHSGNDTIRTGAGNDTVYGDFELNSPTMPGNDPNTSDWIDFGAGNDSVADGYGDNTILGGDGDDTLLAGDGTDSIFGGNGRDMIRSGGGDDIVEGQGGRDTIFGQDGNDKIAGGSNDDTLVGGAGRDTLYGNAGDDLLIAGNPGARDRLFNRIDGGSGIDLLFGQDLSNTVSIESLLGSMS